MDNYSEAYLAHLASDYWQEVRQHVFARDRGCVLCGSTAYPECHHRVYDHLFKEKEALHEVHQLCSEHHKMYEGYKKGRLIWKPTVATTPKYTPPTPPRLTKRQRNQQRRAAKKQKRPFSAYLDHPERLIDRDITCLTEAGAGKKSSIFISDPVSKMLCRGKEMAPMAVFHALGMAASGPDKRIRLKGMRPSGSQFWKAMNIALK